VDCAGQDGRTWRGVRASPGHRSGVPLNPLSIGRFIYHKYKPILYVFDTLDVDHRHTGAEHARYEHGKGSECIKCGVVTSCGYGSGLTRTKVCRAASSGHQDGVLTKSAARRQVATADTSMTPCWADIALEMISTARRRHLQDDEARRLDGTRTNVPSLGCRRRGATCSQHLHAPHAQVPCDPFVQPQGTPQWRSDTHRGRGQDASGAAPTTSSYSCLTRSRRRAWSDKV
jgi:hypothetical protein